MNGVCSFSLWKGVRDFVVGFVGWVGFIHLRRVHDSSSRLLPLPLLWFLFFFFSFQHFWILTTDVIKYRKVECCVLALPSSFYFFYYLWIPCELFRPRCHGHGPLHRMRKGTS